ncbi:hypothetical protein PPYR_06635 [Photinus pyralis]|uniref:Cytochrome P450 n=2 Tax=Photinus pyralis TaxID=7054 RepID=A0A5N4AN24_PHOPY|nr:cytochrome P450 9e2-like [Photinus pyralis]KAB0798755.1 hypothetical protein PPYR_06635 [Photinus pyralis]
MLVVTTLSVIVLSIATFKFLQIWNFWKRKGIPYVNVFHSFRNYAENAFRRNDTTAKLEEIYAKFPGARYIGFYQFLQPVLIVRDPELVRKITVKDFESFTDHNTFITPEIDSLWTKNLFIMKGDWKQTRASLTPLFTANRMRIMLTVMDECTNQLLTFLRSQAENSIHDALDVMTRSAADIFGRTMFGVICNSHVNRHNEFYTMAHNIAAMGNLKGPAFWGYYFCPTLISLLRVKMYQPTEHNFIRTLILESMKVRKEQNIVFPDLVQLLMEMHASSYKSANGVQKRQLSEDEIIAHTLLFCFAGFDTVGYVLSRLCKVLAEHPDIQERLCDEIRRTELQFNGEFTYEALYSMNYLNSVVLETLRMYSPSTILDRKCVKPYLIEPVHKDEKPLLLEKGSWIFVLHCGIQKDPAYYSNPEKFDPDRFSASNKSEQLLTFFTFGSGPRRCIGSRFAIMEMKYLIVQLLRNYELLLPDNNFDGNNELAVYLRFQAKSTKDFLCSIGNENLLNMPSDRNIDQAKI